MEEAGLETEGMAETTSQLQAKLLALTDGKVNIMADANTFKNTTQILREMAAEWEHMTDVEQAAALELLGGKRQANTLSAVISNFDIVEDAIEASANSAGSALEENAKVLDSIQGRINLFNNALETMWNNALDSDLIKSIVNLGTEIIKIIDSIGLLNSAIVGFGGGKLLSILLQATTNTETFGTALLTVLKPLVQIKGTGKTLSQVFAQTAAGAMNAAGGVSTFGAYVKAAGTTLKAFLSTPLGWFTAVAAAIALTVHLVDVFTTTTEELQEELQTLQSEFSDIQSEIDSLNTELETTQARMAELIAMPSLSFIEQEELAELKQTTAELERQLKLKEMLAKSKKDDVISKTEEYINSAWYSSGWDKKYTIGHEGGGGVITEDTFLSRGVNTKDALDEAIATYSELVKADKYRQKILSGESDINFEDGLSDEERKKLYYAQYGHNDGFEHSSFKTMDTDRILDSLEDPAYKDRIKKIADGINMVFADESFDNLKYGMSDEINAFLDELYAYQYKWQEAQGISAKSSAIASIFDDTSSDSIKKLKEDLSSIANDDSLDAAEKQADALELVNGAINSTTGDYDRLKTSMDIIGISADEVARYFVQLSEAPDSSTVEGITNQYQKGVEALGKYKGAATDVIAEFTDLDGSVEQITWGSLFDDEGNAIDTQISKVLQGADETARTEFARIAEAINEGEMTVENAMKSFSISGVQAGYNLLEGAIVEINSDIFKDLGDEISGLIDTFDEFGSALESVANSIELVNQAQAEMAYSGHVSVETALDLINSTEDWNKVLKVENGNISLVDGAMNILAQSKLNQIKTNLQLALSEAQAGLEQARLAESSGEVAKTLEESTTESVRQLAANMTYLSTLIGEFLDGNFFGAHGAAKSAKADSLKATEYQKTSTTSSMTVADWEEKVSNIEAKLGILEGVDTTSEFEDNYSSDKVSGGTKTKKDAEDKTIEDGWEALVNKYENELALITNERDLIEAEIDKAEARGGKASAQYYQDLIDNSEDEKDLLQEKYNALKAYLDYNENAIDPDTWTEYNNELNEIAVAIKECETNTIEWDEAIREIDLHYFEQTTEAISQLGEELDFVNSLLEDEEVADENGNWSSAALTRMGMYTQQMEKAAAEAKLYQDEIDELNTQYANGELSEEQYQERLSELVSGQRDAINSYEDAKDGIVELNEARIDAIKEGIEKEIEAYEDLIDVKKEELDAERDLHDFKNNVKKQTKDIATLERRIAALSGSSNASDIAERRRLEAELLEAREGLNDTYYEHSHDQQSQALDEEAEAFSKSKEKYIEELEATLDNVEALITNSIMDVMLNADTVLAQLNEISTTYGVDLSDALTKPWEDASAQAIAWKNELQESMTAGEYAALIGEGGAITAFANGVATQLEGSWSSAQTAAQKYVDFLTKEELGTEFGETLTGFGDQIYALKEKWDAVRLAAEAAHREQERKVTVGGNPNVGDNGSDNTGDNTDSDDKGGSFTDSRGGAIDNDVERLQAILNQFFNAGLTVDGDYGPKTTAAVKAMQSKIGDIQDGLYTATTKNKLQSYLNKQPYVNTFFKDTGIYIPGALKTRKTSGGGGGGKFTVAMKYAKGTIGTTKDQWALTDEIGDELVLVPGPNGNLSFMRKGTSVVPADITANLVEWGKLNPDIFNIPNPTAGINMITNAVNKPEFNLSFEALVKADKIDQDTLPEVKKFVQQEINSLVKQMNYAIKKFK